MPNTFVIWPNWLIFELEIRLFPAGDKCARQFWPGFPQFLYQVRAMQRDTQFFDLLEACAETGCPVCRLSLITARRYLADILYEFVNDPGISVIQT